MLDTLQEEDKKKIKEIIESVGKKPHYYSKEALFLKKFILALFKQYKYRKQPVGTVKNQEIKHRFFRRAMPIPPTKIDISPLNYAPDFISAKREMPEAPSKI